MKTLPGPLSRPVPVFAAAAVLAGIASAQRTWVVDASGGAGTHFTDLPAAFAAVDHGDRVLVRVGTYTPGTLDKAIQLVAEPGAAVRMLNDPLIVTGIPAWRTCSIQGLTVVRPHGFPVGARFEIRDNDGLVLLSGSRLDVNTYSALFVARSTLGISDSVVGVQLAAEQSEIVATRCTFGGSMTVIVEGITIVDARLDCAQCSAIGFDGGGHVPFSRPAIRSNTSTIVLRGDANSLYRGGTLDRNPASPSIAGNGTTAVIADPHVVLTPAPVGLRSLVRQRMGSLTTRGGAIGTRLDVELFSPAGDPYFLFVALPTMPFDLPPFGRQWLDPASEFFVGGGLQDASEHLTRSFPVPNEAGLRGLALAFQALSGPLPAPALTNPSIPIIH